MKTKRIYIAAAVAVVLVPLALLLHTFSPAPLPEPIPYAGPLPPSATPPQEMAVYAVVAGVNHRVAAFGFRGGSLFERREFSMAGAFVKHPKGDLLIDTGFGRNIDAQFRTLPFMIRAITFYSLWRPAADQLRDVGYDPKSLSCHSSDPLALGPRQRPARLPRHACVGDTPRTRVHQEKQ